MSTTTGVLFVFTITLVIIEQRSGACCCVLSGLAIQVHATKVDSLDSTTFSPSEKETDCPDPNHPHFKPEIFYSCSKIAMGTPFRAQRTLPYPWFVLTKSRIPNGGLGVVAGTFVRAHTWLGEYEGVITTANSTGDKSYRWTVEKKRVRSYEIDGINENTSNWLRYLNCPRRLSEENVYVFFCYGKVYYKLMRDVYPGTELLIYYGHGYAKYLGINLTTYDTD